MIKFKIFKNSDGSCTLHFVDYKIYCIPILKGIKEIAEIYNLNDSENVLSGSVYNVCLFLIHLTKAFSIVLE